MTSIINEDNVPKRTNIISGVKCVSVTIKYANITDKLLTDE